LQIGDGIDIAVQSYVAVAGTQGGGDDTAVILRLGKIQV